MFSQFFVHRPKFAFGISILMMLAVFLCLSKRAVAEYLMPVAEYPEVSPPTISVRMTYAGASAEELAQVVATPVEEQLIGMDDLLYFSSSCSNDGSYSLPLIFDTGTDEEQAAAAAPGGKQRAQSTSKLAIKNLIAPDSLKSSFIPTEDKGAIFYIITLEGTATAKQRTDKVIRQIEERIKGVPGVRMISAQSGFSFAAGSGEGNGMVIVQLEPWDALTSPDLHATAIAANINAACADIPEASVMAMTPPSIQGLGLYGGVSMVLEARGEVTPKEMGDMVKEVCQRLMARTDLIAMARSEYNAETPQLHLEINRQKAQSLKIPVHTIFSTLQCVLASSYVNDFTYQGFNFKVKVQGAAHARRTAEHILNLMVRNEDGVMVPISSVCKLSYRMEPSTYGRFNQYMCADINITPKPGVGSGEVMNAIEETIEQINEEENKQSKATTGAESKRQWAVESRLPEDIKKTGYNVRKRSGDMLCVLAFTCDKQMMDILDLTNWLRINVKDQLSQVDGISEVDIMMSRNYSMRVWMNTTRMSALNITPQDINEAIAAQNTQAAAGSVGSQDEKSYATHKVTATGRLKTVEDFRNIIVKRGEDGHVTRLSDIATIELGAESNSGYSRLSFKNDKGEWVTSDSVGMRVMRNNDANAVATVKALRKKMDEIKLPVGVTWTMVYDSTKAIEATMAETEIDDESKVEPPPAK